MSAKVADVDVGILVWLSVIIFFPVLGYFIYSIADGYQIGKG